MPKKRQHLKSFKPSATASPTLVPSSSSSGSEKTQRSVNELLASLRRGPADPSSSSSPSSHHAITPTVPPALREILQIPETPPPAPRRPLRARVDTNGRRLPAGPPPPRSWLASRDGRGNHNNGPSRTLATSRSGAADVTMPDVYYPSPGSLIGMILGKLASDWAFHRVYDQYHLYFIPSHIKPALMRCVGSARSCGLTLADVKLILFPPSDALDQDQDCSCAAPDLIPNAEIRHLDLTGSIGRSITIKEISELLQPAKNQETVEEPQDSWDAADSTPSPPRALLPNLTHLSLALDPLCGSPPSWKQLLSLSSRLSSITHLSLANWPDPCLTPQALYSTVSTPQGINIPYGGTNLYSHSLDHDWSEALLVLRMLSKNLYALEFLDLTGCGPWFPALMRHSEHDFVDWAGSWGKITRLRLCAGWMPGEDAMPSERESYREIVSLAASVERHIRAMRAGRGRFITVERDVQETWGR